MSARTPAPAAVSITEVQAEYAEWALSVIRDDCANEEDCSYYQHPEAIPTIDGSTLTLKGGEFGKEATLDLLYRLEHQLPEMAADEGTILPSVARLTESIRIALARRHHWEASGITDASL